MGVTAYHALTATTPDDPAYEIRPLAHWNAAHVVSIDLSNSELIKWASAGTQSISSGTLVFGDSNGISFGMNNGTITATVVPGAAAGIAAFGAGTQTATSGTVVFANSNGATFGMSGSTQVTIDFGSSSLAGTGFTTTTVAGSVIAGTHATNGLLLAVPAFLTTQSVQTQASGNIPRTGFTTTTVAGSVVAGTHDTAGLLLAVPAFLTTQSVQTQASGDIARSGFTTTTVAGSVIAGTHDTAGLKLAVPAFLTTQSVQTQASGDIARSGFTTTTVAGSVIAGTHDTAGLKLAVPAYLTTAQAPGAYLTTARASNDAVGLNTALTAGPLAWTVNSSGISLNAGSAAGTTSGFAGTNISGSITHNTAGINLALSVAAPGGGGNTITMYAQSNTTQSSSGTANVSSINFAGAGIASVGVSNGSVVISVPAGGGAGDGYNIVQAGSTGTTGTTWSSLSATISLNGYGALTVSQNNSNQIGFSVPQTSSIVGSRGVSISTNGSTIIVYDAPRTMYVFPQMALSVLGAMGNGSYSIAYRDVLDNVTATRVDMPFHWLQGTTANANTIAIAMTVLCGIYTRNASTLNTVSSASTQTTYTYASNSAGNTQLTVAAYRPISIPININMSRGNYYFGFGISTSASSIGTATTTAAQTISAVGCPQGSSAVPWTDEFTRVTNTSVGMFSGHGIYSAAVASVVPAISLSAINQSGSYFHRANMALVFRN